MKRNKNIDLKAFIKPTGLSKETAFMQKSGALTVILLVIDMLAFVLLHNYNWKISPFVIFLFPILFLPMVLSAIPDAIRFHSYPFQTPISHSCIDSITPYRKVRVIGNDKDLKAKVVTFSIFAPGYSSVKWLPFRGGGRHGYWIVPDDDEEGRGYIITGHGITIVNDATLTTYEQLPPEIQQVLVTHETFNIYTSPIYWAVIPPDIDKKESILKAYSEEYGKKQVGSLVYLLKMAFEDLTHGDTSRKRVRQRSYETIRREGQLANRYLARNREESESAERGGEEL